MRVPELDFTYSPVYDQNLRAWVKEHAPSKPFSEKQVYDYMHTVDSEWRPVGKKILTELSHISGLNWKTGSVKCYVVGGCIPFSDPLTVPIYWKYPDYFIDVLTHEMIHLLFTQPGNPEKSKKAWSYVHKRFSGESVETRVEIMVHAMHSHIYLKFFDEKRMERDYRILKHLPVYKRSWQNVREIGHDKIISEFKKRVSP